jgi:pyruvate kinase
MTPLSDNQIKQQLKQLQALMLETERRHTMLLERLHPDQYLSALNLLDYLTLRSTDIRELQDALHVRGLSSLANAESHIRNQLIAVLKIFNGPDEKTVIDYSSSRALLEQRAKVLFGKLPGDSIPSIMVTLKTSHAYDFPAVKKLLRSGMNIARINCAHDSETIWLELVKSVRQASTSTGLPCKIYMDLAGPKIRTVIPEKSGRILLEEDDGFYFSDQKKLTRDLPVVGSTLPGLAGRLKEGERVLFDDGLFEAKVTSVKKELAKLVVVRVSSKKPYLKKEKGINFPDTQLDLPALTDFDRHCLPFILQHADLVGYSFVHSTTDLTELKKEMKDKKLPLILKIETREAFSHLPGLLLKAMEEEYFGVMVARGDLAVELGLERLSEVQEEICWICEAAHAPLIWATQVLETMNKRGMATRSEATDAAYGSMAECVMLNKGPHTVQAIKALRNILERSSSHHLKKRYRLRPLSIAKAFLSVAPFS